MACESDASVGKSSPSMMPAHDVRLAVLKSVDQQCDGYADMDVLSSATWRPVSGGSINQAYRVNMGLKSLFVKLNHAQYISMFEAEAAGSAAA